MELGQKVSKIYNDVAKQYPYTLMATSAGIAATAIITAVTGGFSYYLSHDPEYSLGVAKFGAAAAALAAPVVILATGISRDLITNHRNNGP